MAVHGLEFGVAYVRRHEVALQSRVCCDRRDRDRLQMGRQAVKGAARDFGSHRVSLDGGNKISTSL
eukprot:187223-Pleurochrysis_carterae.AAC.1